MKKIGIKEKLKKHWLIWLIFLAIIFMIGVHILYKISPLSNFGIAEWTAGELLSYGGAVIGAIATIYVLQETIQSTVNMQKEERILSLRPYFLIEAEKYEEDGGDDCKAIDISNPEKNSIWVGDICILLKVKNVGAGNAVIIKVQLSKNNNIQSEYTYTSLPVIVVNGEQLFLVKFCSPSTLKLKIIYSDIVGLADYMACVEIRIIRSGKVSIYCGIPKIERIDKRT